MNNCEPSRGPWMTRVFVAGDISSTPWGTKLQYNDITWTWRRLISPASGRLLNSLLNLQKEKQQISTSQVSLYHRWSVRSLHKHDDVIKWKHFSRNWPFVWGIHRSPVNSPHKGQWREALIFSLNCVWTNGWVNNREAGDLRRYRAHCDVIVMKGQ